MKTYADRTLTQAATVALETAVQDAIGVLRDGVAQIHSSRLPTGARPVRFVMSRNKRRAQDILLAAAVTAEALLGRTS